MAKHRRGTSIFSKTSPSWPTTFWLRADWFGVVTSTMSCGCWRGRLKQQQQMSALQKGITSPAKVCM